MKNENNNYDMLQWGGYFNFFPLVWRCKLIIMERKN